MAQPPGCEVGRKIMASHLVVQDTAATDAAGSADVFHRVFNSCFEAVISVDADGTIVFFNAAAERLFGYSMAEIQGRGLDALVPDRYRGQHRHFIRAFKTTGAESRTMGRTGEIPARRKDGSEFTAEGTINRAVIDNRLLFTAVLRDVSSRREAELKLRASEEKYRAIVDNAPDAIVVTDAETGLIRESNMAAGELFGCAPEALLGLHQEELHPAESRAEYRRYFREHLEVGRIRVPDAVIVRWDGSEYPVAITARPTTIAGRRVLVGFYRDIRERKRWERDLAQARDQAEAGNRSKSEFLASMSHELRTPLNGIIGFSAMIEGEHLGPIGNPVYREYAGHIQSSGRYLLRTIEEILDYSRLEAGKFTLHEDDFDPGAAIAACLPMVRYALETGGVSLEVSSLDTLPTLRGDHHAFKQVIMNLLSNSIKFTPRRGIVTVAGKRLADGGLEISVADTGVGIPRALQARVFERFEQGQHPMLAARKGTGIGLSLARSIMELHGGTLTLKSAEGKGTTVFARFPADRVSAA
jgi:PAS domain S-box-containing protein